MVGRSAGADLFDQPAGVTQPVCDADFDGYAVEVDRCRTDSRQSAQFGEVEFRKRFFRLYFVCRTHGCLDHAACGAEDDACTGRFAQRTVEIALLQFVEIHVGEADHVGQFARGDRNVYVRIAVFAEFRACGFRFLRHAGHDRYDDEIPAVDAQLGRQVVFGDRAEHLLRRLGRREVLAQFGEMLLHERHPARTAGGHQWDFDRPVAREILVQALEQLGALLHDRKVSGEVGVENVVEAQPTQHCGHLARDAPAFQSEILAEGYAHGGGGLHHDRLAGIGERLHHLPDVAVLRKGAGRTDGYALAAIDAVGRQDRIVEGRAEDRSESPAYDRQGADGLDLVADRFTAAAEDALFHVAHHRRREVHHRLGGFSLVLGLADAEVFGHGLQAAIAVLRAGEAFVGVVREDQLQNGLPGVDDAGCVGADDHPLRADGFAGRSQVFASFDLYDADAADTGVVLAAQLVQVEVAERRNFDADRSGRFDQVGARGDLCGSVVDG